MSKNFKEEVLARRTFAIISHPDAGKTTLTEKLLLFGVPFVTRVQLKGRRQASMRQATGWKLKSSAEFLLPPV